MKMSRTRKEKGVAKGGKNGKAKKVICDNVLFECLKDCASFYDVSYSKMIHWLRGDSKMPCMFVNLELHYATKEEIEKYKNN